MAAGGVGYFGTGYWSTNFWHVNYWAGAGAAPPGVGADAPVGFLAFFRPEGADYIGIFHVTGSKGLDFSPAAQGIKLPLYIICNFI